MWTKINAVNRHSIRGEQVRCQTCESPHIADMLSDLERTHNIEAPFDTRRLHGDGDGFDATRVCLWKRIRAEPFWPRQLRESGRPLFPNRPVPLFRMGGRIIASESVQGRI